MSVLLKKSMYLLLFLGLFGIYTGHSDAQTRSNVGEMEQKKNTLVPDSPLDEEDIDIHETDQHISGDQQITTILQEVFDDPQLKEKKITLHMKNAQARDVIAMIGRSAGIDIVIDNDIKGTIESIDLKDNDAGQALQIVCNQIRPPAALVKLHGTWHVVPREEAKKTLSEKVSREQSYVVMPIRYANVDQAFGEKVKKTWDNLSHNDPNSSINIDEDQKRVHICGKRGSIADFKRYIMEVDKPILQVRIDVVIVSARKDFLFELGFDWSGMYNREQSLKNCPQPFAFYGTGGTVLDFPNPTAVNSQTSSTPKPIVPSPPNSQNPNLFVNPLNFAFNLFNSGLAFMSSDRSSAMVPGLIQLPFVFGGPDLNYKRLNVILNMAETEEKISIISRPSILTSNNKIAKILIGQSIPLQYTFESVNSSDPTKNTVQSSISYKDTGIVLEVRPLVNPDKKSVYLNILVEESIVESGTTQTNEKGIMTNPPTISVIKTKNEVVLRNGQTTIIGGLSTKENNNVKRSVPFLSRFPVIGNLFKMQYEAKHERERYIFITPKIVEYEI